MAYAPGVSDPDPLDHERRTARLVAAGAVGASVAHELRNALAVAESALFLAQRDVDDRARLTRHLDQVGAEIRKAHAVIGSVLGLAAASAVRREAAPVGAPRRHRAPCPGPAHQRHLRGGHRPARSRRAPARPDPARAGVLQPVPQRHRGPGGPRARRHRDARLDGGRAPTSRSKTMGPGSIRASSIASSSRWSRARRGRGLGLALSRAIVEAHPGARSRRPPRPAHKPAARRSACGSRTGDVLASGRMETEAMVLDRHGGPDVLSSGGRSSSRPPGPCQARVRVHAVAMNHMDLWVRRGGPAFQESAEYPHTGSAAIWRASSRSSAPARPGRGRGRPGDGPAPGSPAASAACLPPRAATTSAAATASARRERAGRLRPPRPTCPTSTSSR